jgi:hypothetical protein
MQSKVQGENKGRETIQVLEKMTETGRSLNRNI